ncbi:MAG: hypothetical protein IJN95_05660 [Clostridia bacterium]|nr:hypothetical protein [Clostridia bacterium]
MTEINLSTLLSILKKSLIYIIMAAIVFTLGAFIFCEYIATPTYKAKISFIGANSSSFASQTGDEDGDIKTTDISASRALILTYVDIFKAEDFFEVVAEKSKLDYTAKQLKGMVNVSQRSVDSLFIDVTVTCPDPEHAVKIAETIYDCGGEFLITYLPNAYVKAFEDTNSTAVKNYPNTSTFVFAAAFGGAALVFAAAFLFFIMDKTIKGEKDFAEKYDIPILGSVPNFKMATREEKRVRYEAK